MARGLGRTFAIENCNLQTPQSCKLHLHDNTPLVCMQSNHAKLLWRKYLYATCKLEGLHAVHMELQAYRFQCKDGQGHDQYFSHQSTNT